MPVWASDCEMPCIQSALQQTENACLLMGIPRLQSATMGAIRECINHMIRPLLLCFSQKRMPL